MSLPHSPNRSPPSSQLIRKSNDSRARTLSTLNAPIPSPNKRPLSVLQLDLLHNPVGIKLSGPSAKKSRSSLHDLQAHPGHGQALRRQSSNPRPLDGMANLSSLRTEMEARRMALARGQPGALLKPSSPAAVCPTSASVASLGALAKHSSPAPGAPSTSLLKLVAPVPPLSKPGPRKAFRPMQLSAAALRPARAAKATQALKPPLPVPSANTERPIASVSPSNSKRRAPPTGALAARARLIVEADQSALGMWRSDMEAGVGRPTATKHLAVLKVGNGRGAQVAECVENEGGKLWTVVLRGQKCEVGDEVKVFWPWYTAGESVLLSNRFLINQIT